MIKRIILTVFLAWYYVAPYCKMSKKLHNIRSTFPYFEAFFENQNNITTNELWHQYPLVKDYFVYSIFREDFIPTKSAKTNLRTAYKDYEYLIEMYNFENYHAKELLSLTYFLERLFYLPKMLISDFFGISISSQYKQRAFSLFVWVLCFLISLFSQEIKAFIIHLFNH